MNSNEGKGSVKVSLPDNGRKHWARELEDGAIHPHAEVGDALVFDDREAESGHVVEGWANGKAIVRVLSIQKGRYILRSIDSAIEDIELSKDAVTGVVAFRVWKEPGGLTHTTEYEYGMRHRF